MADWRLQLKNIIRTALLSVFISLFAIAPGKADSQNIASKVLPSVGELYIKYGPSASARFICSVSKIGFSKFLTAGHCVSDLAYAKYTVKFDNNIASVSHITTGVKERPKAVRTEHPDKGAKNEEEEEEDIDFSEFNKEDWAILHTEKDINVPSLDINCHIDLQVGQSIVTAGFPFPAGKSFFQGYIASKEPLRIDGGGSFFTDLKAASGSSGSPVIETDSGDIVGILVTNITPSNRLLFTGVQTVITQGLCNAR